MEIGKKHKVVYKDRNYTKLASGKLISEDNNLIFIEDVKEGEIGIGKNSIVKISKLEERNDIKQTG